MKIVVPLFLSLLISTSFIAQSEGLLTFKVQKELEKDIELVQLDRMLIPSSGFNIPPSDLVSIKEATKQVDYGLIDLSNQNLRTVPFYCCAATWVGKYDLSSNNIRKLGRRFGKVSTDSLDVSDNEIHKITAQGLYARLKYLDISGNELNKFYESRFGMSRLRYLDLSDNDLQYLPNMWKTPLLSELHLGHNQLRVLPTGVGKSRFLLKVSLNDNDFTSIPNELYRLKNLTHLDLSGNGIKSGVFRLRKLSKLKYLDLRENPLKSSDLERLKEMMPNCEILYDYTLN